MPQRVPPFEFSDAALKIRQYLYEHWCGQGHAPNLRVVHEATGLSREAIIEAYKELDLGLILVVDLETQNYNILKMQPFSAFPSQVQVYIGDRFHSYAGCAMESIALSKMPPFAGREIRIESYCACCLAPVSLRTRDGEILARQPESVRIHVSTSPWDWNKTNIIHMCDSMNYVLDGDHAETYERKICRRGVLFTLEQAQRFVAGTGASRMWKYDWPPVALHPQRVVDGIRALGVDVTSWGG